MKAKNVTILDDDDLAKLHHRHWGGCNDVEL